MKNLPRGVFTFLDVSTLHITERDNELLKQTYEFPLSIYEYECGYFVHAAGAEDATQSLYNFGMSEAFIKLWEHACRLDCWYLRLDADGTEFEEFETFEW